MFDEPHPREILRLVAELLRSELIPSLGGELSFKARVAANALDLVRRQIDADVLVAHWRDRLGGLVGRGVPAGEEEAELARRIASGEALDSAALDTHLWRTALDKLLVDQPAYVAGRDAGHPAANPFGE